MRYLRFILCLVVLGLFCGCGGGGDSTSYYMPISTTDPGTDPGTDPETPPETEYVTFYAYNFDLDRDYAVSASLVAEGTNCYVYLQKDKVVDQATIDRVKDEFDTNIYPGVTGAFGSEPKPGIDGDGKVYILLLDIQDGYTPGGSTGYIAGYFDPTNEYDTSVYRYSNEKEMFYMDIYPATAGDADFNDTLAHEFQHMIHWEQKYHLQSLGDATWLNEAMSTVAGTYCGYGPSWYSVWAYEQDVSNSLTEWGSSWKDYGVVYMWAQYFKDRYPDPTYSSIFWRMMIEDSTGISSVNAALAGAGYAKDFDATFRDLSIAVASGTSSWPEHPEWSYDEIETSGVHGGYTLPGLFPVSRLNVESLAALRPYSMNFYWYAPTTPPAGTVAWTRSNSYNFASFINDGASAVTFTMASGSSYDYTVNGYLVEQQTGGASATGGTVTYSSVVQNPSKLADVELSTIVETRVVKSPRQTLAEVNASPALKRLTALRGKKYPIRMDSFFREREQALRNTGARPSF